MAEPLRLYSVVAGEYPDDWFYSPVTAMEFLRKRAWATNDERDGAYLAIAAMVQRRLRYTTEDRLVGVVDCDSEGDMMRAREALEADRATHVVMSSSEGHFWILFGDYPFSSNSRTTSDPRDSPLVWMKRIPGNDPSYCRMCELRGFPTLRGLPKGGEAPREMARKIYGEKQGNAEGSMACIVLADMLSEHFASPVIKACSMATRTLSQAEAEALVDKARGMGPLVLVDADRWDEI